MTDSKTKKVSCPTCNTEVAWVEKNTHRPFCSKRCQLIDFGDWANERNTIAGDPLYPVDDVDPDPLQ